MFSFKWSLFRGWSLNTVVSNHRFHCIRVGDVQYFVYLLAGLLNPLDTPHHVKYDEDSPYREGVVLEKPVKSGRGSYVNVGLYNELQIDKQLRPGLRVTIKMQPEKGEFNLTNYESLRHHTIEAPWRPCPKNANEDRGPPGDLLTTWNCHFYLLTSWPETCL